MKIYIVIVKLLFIGALFIVSNQNLHLSVPVERDTFFDLYYSWLENLFDHSVQITTFVVNSEWLPGVNKTNGLEIG